jgi:rhamnogalacturonan acetylesterase
MLHSQVLSLLVLAATAFAAPSGDVSKRAQTVYLAGDSTMAKANGVITGMPPRSDREAQHH